MAYRRNTRKRIEFLGLRYVVPTESPWLAAQYLIKKRGVACLGWDAAKAIANLFGRMDTIDFWNEQPNCKVYQYCYPYYVEVDQ